MITKVLNKIINIKNNYNKTTNKIPGMTILVIQYLATNDERYCVVISRSVLIISQDCGNSK